MPVAIARRVASGSSLGPSSSQAARIVSGSRGALMLVGAALIIPLFMPSRWRSGLAEVEDYDDEFATTASLVP